MQFRLVRAQSSVGITDTTRNTSIYRYRLTVQRITRQDNLRATNDVNVATVAAARRLFTVAYHVLGEERYYSADIPVKVRGVYLAPAALTIP